MSKDYVDPSGNTEQFRAFVHAPPEKSKGSRVPLIVGAVVVIALVALAIALMLG